MSTLNLSPAPNMQSTLPWAATKVAAVWRATLCSTAPPALGTKQR